MILFAFSASIVLTAAVAAVKLNTFAFTFYLDVAWSVRITNPVSPNAELNNQ